MPVFPSDPCRFPGAAPFCALLLVGGAVGHGLAATTLDVALATPRITRATLPDPLPTGGCEVALSVTVPADAPADLGIGAFVSHPHGAWYQVVHPAILNPGTHRLRLRLAPGRDGVREAATLHQATTGGVFLWSPHPSHATVRMTVEVEPLPERLGSEPVLTDLAWDAPPTTGERWELHARPDPLPRNPYDPDEFALDLVVTTPSGRSLRLPAFWDEPYVTRDGGDRELLTAAAAPRFTVRWRPQEPGVHRLRLESRRGAELRTADLPEQTVGGAAWDRYVRVDPTDRRFLQCAGAFTWPVGINLRSVTDSRGTERIGSRPTPMRGSLAYDAYLARLADGGATAAEVWLSSWNLAMEWRAEWPGYHGAGRYNGQHAWQLDRILDAAWSHGMRIVLALNNHGQGSTSTDKEWHDHPYNRDAGGPLGDAQELYTHADAARWQRHVRRYLVARYADHPAILAWKLWTEMDLTDGGRQWRGGPVADWHAAASAHLHEIDVYQHPITSHWSGSFRSVFDEVARLPGLDLLTIDAYHQDDTALVPLLWSSTQRRGLHRYQKPVLVTEYGGNWDACSEAEMEAEHAVGAWAGLVAGHAGAPMLWWFEWVDQGARFAPYRAIQRFIAGEDLRHPEARSLILRIGNGGDSLWAAGWSRRGRMLGYLVDQEWQKSGGEPALRQNVTLRLADAVEPGAMTAQWWNADTGEAMDGKRFQHAGGALELTAPDFRRHIAFKLWRE